MYPWIEYDECQRPATVENTHRSVLSHDTVVDGAIEIRIGNHRDAFSGDRSCFRAYWRIRLPAGKSKKHSTQLRSHRHTTQPTDAPSDPVQRSISCKWQNRYSVAQLVKESGHYPSWLPYKRYIIVARKHRAQYATVPRNGRERSNH